MNTPIYDFLTKYRSRNPLRMHMPGHKGKGRLGVEGLDLTEVGGADVLYSPSGIIRESEACAEKIFGTGRTVYSTEGSSLSIRAMIALVVKYAKTVGRRATILAARNVHRSFTSAVALTGAMVEWLFPDGDAGIISSRITPKSLEAAIDGMESAPIAFYVTSPDYLGSISDVAEMARICHARGVLLLVDNAHGAYLRFLPRDAHPITLGADLCCDSAHKTLPVLTGGGYLHVSANAPKYFSDEADGAMATFASTSPSYLILASLDLANEYLSGDYRTRLSETLKEIDELKRRLASGGYTVLDGEPMKITLYAKPYGYTGEELAAILAENDIEVEFADRDYLTLMPSPECDSDFCERIASALLSVKRGEPIDEPMPKVPRTEPMIGIREATFAPSERIAVEDCFGRILADIQLACPPAIPIVVSGERIDGDAIEAMKYYGIKECKVII